MFIGLYPPGCVDCPPEVLSRSQDLAEGLPGGSVVKNLPANAGDTGPTPDLGRSHVPRDS